MTRFHLSIAIIVSVVPTGVFPQSAVAQDVKVPPLAEPFLVMAGDEPIAVTTGHAAPFVYDFNKDGKKDLVVGEFGVKNEESEHPGRARVYLNIGTDAAPVFKEFSYLEAQGKHASVPSG